MMPVLREFVEEEASRKRFWPHSGELVSGRAGVGIVGTMRSERVIILADFKQLTECERAQEVSWSQEYPLAHQSLYLHIQSRPIRGIRR